MRKRAASVLVYLLLGAMMTVIVSAVCAVTPIPRYGGATVINRGDLDVVPDIEPHIHEIACDLWSHPGLHEVNLYWTSSSMSGTAPSPSTTADQLSSLYQEICEEGESESRHCEFVLREQLAALRRGPLPPRSGAHTPAMLYVESGFPFHAMSGMIYWPNDSRGSAASPVELWSWHIERPLLFRTVSRAIPLRPRPLPFIANTVVYALVIYLVCLAWRAGRSGLRRRRGRCPRCAYDISHAEHPACPECGWIQSTKKPRTITAPESMDGG